MRVYHFLNSKYGLEALRRKRLKIARINELNDPFEWLAVRLADKRFRQVFEHIKRDQHDEYGLICFSKQWADPVLWSHYGDRHRGLALGFDIPETFATVVDYVPDRIDWHCLEDGRVPQDVVARNHITKFNHWAYEEEVRMFVGLDEGTIEGELYFYSFDSSLILREIVIGPLCELDKQVVIDATGRCGKKVELRKARLGFNEYKIVEQKKFKVRKL